MAKKISRERIEELRSYPVSYRLQKLRWMAGYTQNEFSDLIGCTQATVSLWERGQFTPSGKMIERIIGLYDLPDNYFIDIDIEKVNMKNKNKKDEVEEVKFK